MRCRRTKSGRSAEKNAPAAAGARVRLGSTIAEVRRRDNANRGIRFLRLMFRKEPCGFPKVALGGMEAAVA